MFTLRRFLPRALLLALLSLAGCRSVLNLPPAAEIRGGFTVSVEVPPQPSAARVFADIGAFAGRRGFVRQGARKAPSIDPATHQPLPPAPERYLLGKIALEVSYDASHLRVSAYLHSGSGHDRKVIARFYPDFDQEYVPRYGDETTINELNFGDDSSSPPRSRGSSGRGGSR